MKPETPGQPTLMEELKASTLACHARLQEAPFFQALAAGQLPIESYVGQLRALSVIHGALEHEIEGSPDETVASVWDSGMRKLPALQKDLRYFEPRAVADIKESVEEALQIAGDIRLRSLRQPLALLGYVYVLEGSMLGARVLRPQMARAFQLEGNDGLSYLNHYGADVDAHWSQYRQRMDALQLGPDGREQVVHAACRFFTQVKFVFDALYPFKPESKAYLAVSINPEAGRHPVPADMREIQASLRAADSCWQRFPYFESRYGERGQRFAKSDGAWLATLCQFDQPRMDQQVRWLGRVLAARGMPTLLLQAHLEILADELTAAVPEKKPLYEKLQIAAVALREWRGQQIDDGYLQILDDEFHRAVGPSWNGRNEHAGLLLAAAVADEMNGNVGAIDGVKQWMTDASRFHAEWIAAAEDTITKAQAYAFLRAGQGGQGLEMPQMPVIPAGMTGFFGASSLG